MALDDGRLDPMVRALDAAKHRYGQPIVDTLKWMVEIDPDDRPQRTHEVLDRFIEHYRTLTLNATGDAATQATRIESMPVALSEEDRTQAELLLSTYLGPIAKVLVREAMEAGGTRSEFYEGLARELASSTEREEFLARIRAELG